MFKGNLGPHLLNSAGHMGYHEAGMAGSGYSTGCSLGETRTIGACRGIMGRVSGRGTVSRECKHDKNMKACSKVRNSSNSMCRKQNCDNANLDCDCPTCALHITCGITVIDEMCTKYINIRARPLSSNLQHITFCSCARRHRQFVGSIYLCAPPLSNIVEATPYPKWAWAENNGGQRSTRRLATTTGNKTTGNKLCGQ